ncbi:MAG: hypothetical protein ABI833_19695 [Acidobacteriota bacterium]
MDSYARFRGNTSTPTQEEHKVASVYRNLGGGGVDFPAVAPNASDEPPNGRGGTWRFGPVSTSPH